MESPEPTLCSWQVTPVRASKPVAWCETPLFTVLRTCVSLYRYLQERAEQLAEHSYNTNIQNAETGGSQVQN